MFNHRSTVILPLDETIGPKSLALVTEKGVVYSPTWRGCHMMGPSAP